MPTFHSLAELFHGSIEQNLRMCRPDASADDLRKALLLSDALDTIDSLDEGIQHYIGDYRSEQLSSNLVYQLTLSRAYLRDASIMLIDEMPPKTDFPENGRAVSGIY